MAYRHHQSKLEIPVRTTQLGYLVFVPHNQSARYKWGSRGHYPHFGESKLVRPRKGNHSLGCSSRDSDRSLPRRIGLRKRTQSYRTRFRHLLDSKRSCCYHRSKLVTPIGVATDSYFLRSGSICRSSSSSMVPCPNGALPANWVASDHFEIAACYQGRRFTHHYGNFTSR